MSNIQVSEDNKCDMHKCKGELLLHNWSIILSNVQQIKDINAKKIQKIVYHLKFQMINYLENNIFEFRYYCKRYNVAGILYNE